MTITDYTYDDPELGRFHIRVSLRARRLTFRARDRELWVTIPVGASVTEVKQAIDSLRPRLRLLMSAQARPLMDGDYRIDAPCFHLSLVKGTTSRFLLRREGDDTQIVYPPDTDFTVPALQDGCAAWCPKPCAVGPRKSCPFAWRCWPVPTALLIAA